MAYPAVRTPFFRFIAMRDMSLGAPELGGCPACSGKPFAQMNEPFGTGSREANWSASCDEPIRTALHKRTLIESSLQPSLNIRLLPFSRMFSASPESVLNDRVEARRDRPSLLRTPAFAAPAPETAVRTPLRSRLPAAGSLQTASGTDAAATSMRMAIWRKATAQPWKRPRSVAETRPQYRPHTNRELRAKFQTEPTMIPVIADGYSCTP